MFLGSFYHGLYLNYEVALAAGSNEVIKEEKNSGCVSASYSSYCAGFDHPQSIAATVLSTVTPNFV